MEVREKLVELLNGIQHYGTICTMSQMDDRYASVTQVSNTEVTERLISHGVTVQEWISVKDRLPEPKKLVLCIWKDINGIHYGFSRYQHDNVWYVSNEGMPEVTHWMKLPQLPKGE